MADQQEAQGRPIHMIGNAHIDPVWLWRWPEGMETTRSSFRAALDRMNEYPDFKFTSAQAALYWWVEQTDPAMFEEIRQRVAEGRWELAGGWWVQPDCNVPSGEAFARQALYGQGYFLSRFGKLAKVGYNVDSFGHDGMLPQLLKKSGLDYYIFFRPGPYEKTLPAGLFQWIAPDGSTVIGCRAANHYCVWQREALIAWVNTASEWMPTVPDSLCFYGVGNHGGGPTIDNIEAIHDIAVDPEAPAPLCSTLEAFFETLKGRESSFPRVPEELQHHARGCYSVTTLAKHLNRQCEEALATAEKWAALAFRLKCKPYPLERFTEAWRRMLFNQFHDILAGTSIKPAYEDVQNAAGYALHIASEAQNFAQQAIAARLDTSGEGTTLVCFNPQGWKANIPMTCDIPGGGPSKLLDELGNEVPYQRNPAAAKGALGRMELCFEPELPAWGWRAYKLLREEPAPVESALTATTESIENPWLRVTISSETGGLAQVLDKRTGVELLSAPQSVDVFHDTSDTWSHELKKYDQLVGAFEGFEAVLEEAGPIRAVVRTRARWGASTLIQRICLWAGQPWVEVKTSLEVQDQFKAFKLTVPFGIKQPELHSSMSYGFCERVLNGEEEPMHAWLDLSGCDTQGRNAGFAVLNDGKYGYDADEKALRITLLRSTVYAWHDPYKLQPDEWNEFIDQGRHDFTWRLVPHASDFVEGRVPELALELNSPPSFLLESSHEGYLPLAKEFITISADHIGIPAIKQSEDGESLIIRAVELAGQPKEAVFLLPHSALTWSATFTPQEVKTFRITGNKVVECDLLERPI